MSFLKPLFTTEKGKILSRDQQLSLVKALASVIAEILNKENFDLLGNFDSLDNFSWRRQVYDDLINVIITFSWKAPSQFKGINLTPESFQETFLDTLEDSLDLSSTHPLELVRDSSGVTNPCDSSDGILQAQLAFQLKMSDDEAED